MLNPLLSADHHRVTVAVERLHGLAQTTGQPWDTVAADSAERNFFHDSRWARVLRDTYGFTPLAFISPAGAAHPGILPVLEINSWLTGRRGTSLPFTDECEPLVDHPEAFASLWKAAIDYGRQRRWQSLEIRGGQRWFRGTTPSVTFRGHRLTLSRSEAALFQALDPAVRRGIRKADQSGLTVEFARSPEAMRVFYGLLSKTRQRHGLPPQPFSFFRMLQRTVLADGNGWVVLARKGSTPVAGAIFLHSGANVIYKFGASDEAFQSLRGNNLVMWRAIQRYAQDGLTALDFGRTSLGNEGLRRFKLSWGTTERVIAYFKYDLRRDGFVSIRDQADGWHNHVFRRLPQCVSQCIGAALYKHID